MTTYPPGYEHPGFIWVSHPMKLEYHPPVSFVRPPDTMSPFEATIGLSYCATTLQDYLRRWERRRRNERKTQLEKDHRQAGEA